MEVKASSSRAAKGGPLNTGDEATCPSFLQGEGLPWPHLSQTLDLEEEACGTFILLSCAVGIFLPEDSFLPFLLPFLPSPCPNPILSHTLSKSYLR